MRNNSLLFRNDFMMDRIKDARNLNQNLYQNQNNYHAILV